MLLLFQVLRLILQIFRFIPKKLTRSEVILMRNTGFKSAFLAVAGFLSGLVNGLLGAGGGIISVFALSYILKEQKCDRRDAFANTLCIMLPISLISAVGYANYINVPDEKLNSLILPAIAGGLFGGLMLDRIKGRWVRIIFSAIVLWSGFTMLIR